MSKKNAKVAALVEGCRGRSLDAHYLAYFECFNGGLFFEAHDVLEHLWLAGRGGPNHNFFKGMIQLAGAFVHLQRNRLRPADALFKLAGANLRQYPAIHEQLDVAAALEFIAGWQRKLAAGEFAVNPLTPATAPRLELIP